jgi:peroxin-3
VTDSLLNTIYEQLQDKMNIDLLTTRLRHLKKQESQLKEEEQREKTHIWEDIKIWSFSRTITAIYIEVLLYLLIRIQLIIISKEIYMESLKEGDISSEVITQIIFFPFNLHEKKLDL